METKLKMIRPHNNIIRKDRIDFGKLKTQDYKEKYQEKVIEMLK